MQELIVTNSEPLVFIRDGIAMTTSLDMAEFFDKRHGNVLRDIRGLISSDTTPADWFRAATYINEQNGESYPAFYMTRDGFTLLTMGFTGAKAHAFKVAYIAAFGKMEKSLRRTQPVAKLPRLSGALLREAGKTLDRLESMGLSPVAQQAFSASLYRACGLAVAEPVIKTEKYFSTTEIAEAHDMKPHMLGKMVKHLKNDAHGQTRLTTTSHGVQVPQFWWNGDGKAAIDRMLRLRLN